MIKNLPLSFVTGVMTVVALSSFPALRSSSAQQPASDVAIDSDDLGGVVTGPKGPEAASGSCGNPRSSVRYIRAW